MPYIVLVIVQLVFLSAAMSAAYAGLLYLFPLFFENRLPRFPARAVRSLSIIIVLNLAIDIIALSIPNMELGNRILHGLGGGSMAFIVCFFAARDSGVRIRKFQFFVFSAFAVTALGVGNEIFEYALDALTPIVIVNDTWPDLVANTVGLLVAGGIFAPWWDPTVSRRDQ